MMKQLSVAALQMEQAQKDIATNVSHLKKLLSQKLAAAHYPEIDLLVLPEMWTTGFVVKVDDLPPSYLAEAYELGRTTMLDLSQQYGAALYGTLIEPMPSGKPANTGLFVTPEGEVTEYRKKHLFRTGGEAATFEAGSKRVQVNYRGWQIRLSTCYDLRFPTWLRQDPSLGLYHLLLCSANWPKQRQLAWERLLRARAIENQCYLVATNRTGMPHPKIVYPGYSFILDDLGESIVESKLPEERLLAATLSLEALEERRQIFPLLQDLDPFRLL